MLSIVSSENVRWRRYDYAEATRRALVAAGRAAFASDGYQAAALEAISRSARVTRGAFYHHFEDKKALFDAVVGEMQSEAAAKIEARAKTHKALCDRLGAGIEAYLDTCLEPDYGRIVIREGPVVLGAKRYREIEEAFPMALLAATLGPLKRRGELDIDDIDLLCRMIDALVCEVATMLVESADASLRKRGQAVIARFLASYRMTK